MGFWDIAIAVSLAAVAVILVLGLISLFRGREDRSTSNKLMQMRVVFQALAIGVIALASFFATR
jgi:hypothetical protein